MLKKTGTGTKLFHSRNPNHIKLLRFHNTAVSTSSVSDPIGLIADPDSAFYLALDPDPGSAVTQNADSKVPT